MSSTIKHSRKRKGRQTATDLAPSGDDIQTVELTLERYREWGDGPMWGFIETVDGEEDCFVASTAAGMVWKMLSREGIDDLAGLTLKARVVANKLTPQPGKQMCPWVAIWVDVSEAGGIYEPTA